MGQAFKKSMRAAARIAERLDIDVDKERKMEKEKLLKKS